MLAGVDPFNSTLGKVTNAKVQDFFTFFKNESKLPATKKKGCSKGKIPEQPHFVLFTNLYSSYNPVAIKLEQNPK